MNENNGVIVKQKSNKGVMIVLIILIVGALGYIVYDKFIARDTKPQVNDTTNAIVTTTKDNNINIEDLYKQYINNT